MVSSRSPGCSTAIESLIPALTARVLQLYAAVPTRTGIFTKVTWEICNYCPINKIILGGFSQDLRGRTNYSDTGISLREMLTFRSRLRWKKGCCSSCRCWSSGLLVQTDLGRLECTPPCAQVGSGRQTQANYVYNEQTDE